MGLMVLVMLMVAALQRLNAHLTLSSTLASSIAMAVLGGWLVGGAPTLLDFLTISLGGHAEPHPQDDETPPGD